MEAPVKIAIAVVRTVGKPPEDFNQWAKHIRNESKKMKIHLTN